MMQLMMSMSVKRRRAALVIALSLAGCLSLPGFAEAQVRAEAYIGVPFGVGRVEVNLAPHTQPEVLGVSGLGLAEKDGRVFYPAIGEKPIRGLLRGLLNRPRPTFGRSPASVYFLFQGDDPLELTIQSQKAHTFVVSPRLDPRAHDLLLWSWWREYTAGRKLLEKKPDYPPLVENYLQCMLAPRLGLQLPEKRTDGSWQSQVEEQIGLAMGTESMRIAFQRQRLQGRTALDEPADRPLPDPPSLPEPDLPEPAADVQVDPIAMRVPAECFYVRFGSFSNFLWLQDTLEQWGGDLRNLVCWRGLDYGLRQRIEDRLVVRQTALARLLGDTVIADVAIIGSDLFFQEGAAFGILFHARLNNAFLEADIKRQWLERVQAGDGVTEGKITLAGHEVAFLSSADGSVRSFHVADGGFHFVTTSRTLARRFIETGSGKGALGASKEFRLARTVMPLDRNDTVFVYLSDAFLRNIVGPEYRVETVRRMQALADLELVQLALLAAAAEGKPGETIEQLIQGGFLPADFGPRPDGSRTVFKDGEAYDSLRGRRGAFLPVPDVELAQVTRSEVAAYREFHDLCFSKWERLDPIILGIKRQALPRNQERIVLDARLSPLATKHFELLGQFVGAADKMRFAPIADDAVAGQIVFPGHRLFGGLQDFRPPLELMGNMIIPVGRFRDMLVGYVGSTGDLGLLGFLDNRITGPPDASGYAVGPAGLWRHRSDQFTVFSFQGDVLKTVVPQLRLEEAQRPAQLRLHVGDLSGGRLAPILNDIGYARTRQTSLGNIRLMHQLAQQLHVPGEHCRETAERLLDAKLICPLGGEYVYRQTPDGVGFWTSTALANQQSAISNQQSAWPGGLFTTRAPEGYQSPPLNWFRGLDLDAMLTPEVLSAHGEIVMQEPDKKK